jgi:hypothetical protein
MGYNASAEGPMRKREIKFQQRCIAADKGEPPQSALDQWSALWFPSPHDAHYSPPWLSACRSGFWRALIDLLGKAKRNPAICLVAPITVR